MYESSTLECINMNNNKITTIISPPPGSLDVLSQHEVSRLRDASGQGLHELLRRCALAVLNSGVDEDDAVALLEKYASFDIRVLQRDHGLKLELIDAPAVAFVNGKMIAGVREHLFAVLRDIVYVSKEMEEGRYQLGTSDGITNLIFHIIRNAGVLRPRRSADIAVCWGGHSIGREEYDYTKKVGYELGLRYIDICTGCGPGAMKGPMKGAAIAHAKQRNKNGRYIGITEPGIIASEPPNPIVNELVIMPDIEKRLEAFVRVGHGVVVFPGGVGTAEEILYLLGLLLHPKNQHIVFPFILTGPAGSADYFKSIDDFVGSVLGESAQQKYEIIVDDPQKVAIRMAEMMEQVMEFRKQHGDAFYFNWRLYIDMLFQQPFDPTHESMAALDLNPGQPVYELASNMRCAFSGLVAGNVKESGIRQVRKLGPFKIRGDQAIMEKLDILLETFAAQNRMKLPGKKYVPCYALIK